MESALTTYHLIYGVPRSGTTALQDLICATLGSESMPECTYLTQIIELYARTVQYPDPIRFPYFFGTKKNAQKVYAGLARSMVERMAALQPIGKPVIMKDPMICLSLMPAQELLGEQFSFIGMVRHPAETVASMKRVRKRSGAPWNLEAETAAAYRQYDGIRAFQETATVKNLVIRYEDLIERAERTVAAIETHIGAKLVWSSTEAEWLSHGTAFSSEGYGKPFDRSFSGLGAETLDRTELNYVQDVLAGIRQHWGYDRR